ncbi:MAG: DUF488 domain-containing protein [Syntrophobacteraceae bacterium]
MGRIELYTIGFTKKSAEQFFALLSGAGVKRVLDIRLNNVSQLAGFAKRDDLRFFLKAICRADYLHMPDLAPTKEILDRFRKSGNDWPAYEKDFLQLISDRQIEKALTPKTAHRACLLCSEETPGHCHRRLVAEYLADKWGKVEIIHLV